MRDKHDNVVVVCSIENLDPMGVHTGDSITVAPAMTLTDREYQHMRDIGIAVLREVGVDTGGCNIQFAIDPARRPDDRHRDEPAGVPLVGARVQGHRLPDRQDRGEARGRLHARRDPQRHHAQDAGRVRADPRLRRGQGAAVRLREVPRRRPGADHAHEERRRGDVDRPQLHRGARQGAALDGDQGGRLLDASPDADRPAATSCSPRGRDARPTAGSTSSSRRCAPARAVERGGRGHRHRPVVRRPDRADRRGAAPRCVDAPTLTAAAAAQGEAARPVRPADRRAAPGTRRRGRRALAAAPARHPAGLQDRRHLRGRVRGHHAVPLLVLRRGDRGARRSRTGRR